MHLTRCAVMVLTGSVLWFALTVHSQNPAATPGNGQSQAQKTTQEFPVIRATTRLVEITVVVQDKSGNPIRGLTKDDFAVADEGQPQVISVFAAETGESADFVSELTPGVFVNRPEQHPGVVPGATVVLLDGLNTRLIDQGKVRDNVLRMLKQLQPQDRISVYALDMKLRLLHEFTNDPEQLRAALESYKRQSSARTEDFQVEQHIDANSQMDEVVAASKKLNQQIGDSQMRDRVERTAGAMEDIAHHLAGVRGRKNLIWVSSGFPIALGIPFMNMPDTAVGMNGLNAGPTGRSNTTGTSRDATGEANPLNLIRQPRDFSAEVQRAIRSLNDADIAVYPVDARGALGVWDIDPNLNRPRGHVQIERADAALPTTELQTSEATMRGLAEETGGRAFNNHDLGTAVRRAIDDARVTYTLAFYPSHSQWDGKFHRLAVAVKKPGAHLFYRRGYFASSAAPIDQAAREQQLQDVVTSPLDATVLGLTAHPTMVDDEGRKLLHVQVLFSPREITFNPVPNGWAGKVDLMFLEMNQQGKILVSSKGTLDLSVTAEQRRTQQGKPFAFSHNLELMPGAQSLRIVALDAMSGAVGSLTILLNQVR